MPPRTSSRASPRRRTASRRASPLHAAAEEIASRVPSYWGTVEPIDEHSCEYRTGDDDLGWLALRIAMLGVDFDVHEPPELAEHLRALAGRLRRAAGRSPREKSPAARR